ncbi:hypothetical protein GCM10029978_066500 [Actinoallomurus acanthiterrae]
MSTDTEIGQRIERARIARGLTRAQLAGDDTTQFEIVAIETGTLSAPAELIRSLAMKFKCPPSYLTDGVPAHVRNDLQTALAKAGVLAYSGSFPAALKGYQTLLDNTAVHLLSEVHRDVMIGASLCYEGTGDFTSAINVLKELIATATPSDWHWADAHAGLSRCHRRSGDPAEAEAVAQRAMDELENTIEHLRLRNRIVIGVQLLAAKTARSDRKGSISLARELIDHFSVDSPTPLRFMTYDRAARSAATFGDVENVVQWADIAYKLASINKLIDDKDVIARYTGLLLETRNPRVPLRTLPAVRKSLLTPARSPDVSIARLILLVRTEINSGAATHALPRCDKLMKLVAGAPPALCGHALAAHGDALAAKGRYEPALHKFKTAARLLEESGLISTAADIWTSKIGKIYGKMGNKDKRVAANRRAANIKNRQKSTVYLIRPDLNVAPHASADAKQTRAT